MFRPPCVAQRAYRPPRALPPPCSVPHLSISSRAAPAPAPRALLSRPLSTLRTQGGGSVALATRVHLARRSPIPFLRRSYATEANAPPLSAASSTAPPPPPPPREEKPIKASPPNNDQHQSGGSGQGESGRPAGRSAGSILAAIFKWMRNNKGILWTVLLINFIVWLNSFMLDAAEGKIAESLDFDLTDDEKLFAWNSLKMLAQFQPPHADRRFRNHIRNVVYEGVADAEPLVQEAALAVLNALAQTNEIVQAQVMKDLDSIGFDRLWDNLPVALVRTKARPVSLSTPGSSKATETLPERIRYRLTSLFAYLASHKPNHASLSHPEYTSKLLLLADATAGSTAVFDRLARQDIAGTIYSLTMSEESRQAMFDQPIIDLLVKLKAEGPDNAPGTMQLAAKALVGLSALPEAKTAKHFPTLTAHDLELAKQEVPKEGEERQSFWQWWKPADLDETQTDRVLSVVKPTAFVATVAYAYGALRTAAWRRGQWRDSANWKNALTRGGPKATAGALTLMGMSMAFDVLVSTPLEKRSAVPPLLDEPCHPHILFLELTTFVLALPLITQRFPYCLAPVMGSVVYEIYQNYTEDFVPEQVENANDFMDTTLLTLQLKERIETAQREEAVRRANAVAQDGRQREAAAAAAAAAPAAAAAAPASKK